MVIIVHQDQVFSDVQLFFPQKAPVFRILVWDRCGGPWVEEERFVSSDAANRPRYHYMEYSSPTPFFSVLGWVPLIPGRQQS